ncbi:MAG TPA: 3-oxoacyl-[acyl-carrier-protein] synthase III C-terminal domain-containing protein [Acidimicrobiales bacterium]|nr:3-oxoacyl-[acyl-carrier-protein] synthase III C-terminal domain-containing protein [Acidimicrobiales bacterium]
MSTTAAIVGAGQAFPAGRTQEEYWDRFYGPHVGGNRWARAVFLSAGCTTRHTAVDPTVEDISGWSTGARMGRYLAEALPLAEAAARGALAAAGLGVADLGLLAVVSCTGYTTPGLDIRLAEALGADPSLQRLLIGHMGCYAALPGLAAVADTVAARGRPALLVCAEVASLHVQPPSVGGGRLTAEHMEQVVAHALFSDGAAAVVVAPSGAPGALEVLDVAARTDVAAADHMRWDITDLGFRMGLSRRVPDVLARHVGALADGLLAAHGLGRDDVAGWVVHPGGPRILDVVAEQLGLDAHALDSARAVLDEHGNCSSGTVLAVLDRWRAAASPAPGSHAVMLAFGPGLTIYGVLLRVG